MLKFGFINACLKTAVVACVAAMTIAGSAHAETPLNETLQKYVVPEIEKWAHHPVALIAINAQNERHANLTQQDIDAFDQEWRKQRKQEQQPLIAQLFGSPLSSYLTRIQANSLGLYSEIFVMDAVGLNVGLSSVSSDYWQGDEAKWQKTYQVGPKAVFIDEPEANEETATTRVQVNMAITDPQSGKAIGAITVEVNVTELARRHPYAANQ